MATQSFPNTSWLRQDKSLNPAGVINPATGQPYIYADGQAPAVPAESSFLSSNNNSEVVTPAEKPIVPAVKRSKYINPATGKFFTPEEYGNYVATKIPVASDVPKYAGDAMTDPNQSATNLEGIARNLNNARNDIAVGQTDPYKVGNKSGIAYSPNELKAIEKAYAGIYDPALNDVFARLKEKKDADEKEQRKQDQIFATNESIRQWQATTGSKQGAGNSQDDLNYQRVVNGVGDISSMTPTDSTAVQNRLYSDGYYDPDPPAWFKKQMEEEAQKSLTPALLASLWEAHRNPIIASITSSLNGLKMDFSNPGQ